MKRALLKVYAGCLMTAPVTTRLIITEENTQKCKETDLL